MMYILDTMGSSMVKEALHYFGVYRDDNIAVLKGDWSVDQITRRLDNFQESVNSITGSNFLKFATVI